MVSFSEQPITGRFEMACCEFFLKGPRRRQRRSVAEPAGGPFLEQAPSGVWALAGLLALGWAADSAPRNFAPPASSSPEAAAAMPAAADRFLASLPAELRTEAVFPFDAAERTRWHFIPSETHPRRGVAIKQMSEAQRTRAHDLLRSGLSEGGYMTATAVMELEGILRDLEGSDGRFVRDPEQYFFSVFGTPAAEGAWGWRVEGHHLSLHFTIVEGAWVPTAPAFFGANPAEVREGPRTGLRILGEREDVARQLV